MIRRLFLFILILFSLSSHAQGPKKPFVFKERFISSAGLNYSQLQNYSTDPLYGINATPSFNLLNDYSDFSISLAVTTGASYHPSTKNDSTNYFLFSFPAFVQFNLGHLASHDFYSSLGFFAGVGYNTCIIKSISDNGFSFSGGFRFWLLQRSFTVRYTQSRFEKLGFSLYEMSLQLNLGAYLPQVLRNNKISTFTKPFHK